MRIPFRFLKPLSRIPVATFYFLAAVALRAQPAADQYIPRYKDDVTPYPLYAGKFGNPVRWTPERLRLIADHFDAFYGNPDFSADDVKQLRAIKPGFQVVNYKGNWTIKNYAGYERNHRHDMLYYRVGNLHATLDPRATQLSLDDVLGQLTASTAAAGERYSGSERGEFRHVVWLLLDDEYVRVESIDGHTATITRGFDGTTPAAHSAGIPVLAPVYGAKPTDGKRGDLRYRHDPGSPLRWLELEKEAEKDFTDHGGGIWIDIITGNLSCSALDGRSVPMNRRWNFHTRAGYTETEWNHYASVGLKLIQERFKTALGFYPVVWGNNLTHPTSTEGNTERLQLLQPTAGRPRALDGFAQENSYGGYGSGGNSGKDYSWRPLKGWEESLQSIMYLGELRVSARPLMLDGGKDNVNFAAEPAAFREQVLLFGYASYLLAVRVEPDGRIYSMVGFTPIVGPADSRDRDVIVPPWFQWDIGRPVETRASTDFAGYKLPGKTVFQRRFENGLVLVNPADTGTETVTLDHPYVDPLTNQSVTQITLPSKTGRILLHLPAAH